MRTLISLVFLSYLSMAGKGIIYDGAVTMEMDSDNQFLRIEGFNSALMDKNDPYGLFIQLPKSNDKKTEAYEMNQSLILQHLFKLSRSGRNELKIDAGLLTQFLYSNSMLEYFKRAQDVYIARGEEEIADQVQREIYRIQQKGEEAFGRDAEIGIGIKLDDFIKIASKEEVAAATTNETLREVIPQLGEAIRDINRPAKYGQSLLSEDTSYYGKREDGKGSKGASIENSSSPKGSI